MQETLDYHGDHFRGLRKLLYMNMPRTTMDVSVHDKPLIKYTFETLRLEEPAYNDGWGCNGKYLCGCRGGKDYYNNNEEEYRYHCVECSFDNCEECYKFYGNTHNHELQHLTHKEIMDLHPGSY